MTELVRYDVDDRVARIVFDDGKVNVMSPDMLRAIGSAVDRASEEAAAVILMSGRPGVFSAGFDLKVFAAHDSSRSVEMVRLGAELALRILMAPAPVVAACNGHAYPMGAFLILASDVRVAADGPFRIGLNEVAIGIPVPSFGLELARQRLAPAYLHRTALTGEMYSPREALSAGFFDKVVQAETLAETAHSLARTLTSIDLASHALTKHRLRQASAAAIQRAIDEELTLEQYERRAAEGPSRVRLPS